MSNNSKQKTPIKWLKLISTAFLGFITLIILVLALAFSSFGVSLLSSVVNKQPGIYLGGVTGSLYSQVLIKNISIDIPTVKVDAENIIIDLGLNCIFVGEACIDTFDISEVVVLLKQTETTPENDTRVSKDYIKLPLPFSLSQMNVSRLSVLSEVSTQEVTPLLDLHELTLELAFFQDLKIQTLYVRSLNLLQAELNYTTSKGTEDKDLNQQIEQLLKAIHTFEYSGLALPQIFVSINFSVLDALFTNICFIQDVAQLKSDKLIEQLQKIDFKKDFQNSVCTNNTAFSVNMFNQRANVEFSSEPAELKIGLAEASLTIDLSNQFEHKILGTVYPNSELIKEGSAALIYNMEGNLKEFTATLQQQDFNNQSFDEPIIKANFAGDISVNNLPISVSLIGKKVDETSETWFGRSVSPLKAFSLMITGDTASYDIEGDISLAAVKPTNVRLNANASVINKVFLIQELSTSGELGEFNANGQASIREGLSKESGKIHNQIHVLNFDTNIEFKEFAIQALTNEMQSNLNGEIKLEGILSADTKSFDMKCNDIKGMVQHYNLELLCDVKLSEDGVLDIQKFALNQSENSIKATGKISLPTDFNNMGDVQVITQSASQIDNNLALNIDIQDLSNFHNSLSGAIIGDAAFDGTIFSPIVSVDLSLDRVQFDQFKIETGQLKAYIDANNDFDTDVSLQLNVIEAPERVANSVLMTLIGNKDDHRLDFQLIHSDYRTEQKLEGKIVGTGNNLAWQGQWLKGLVQWRDSNLELINKDSEKFTDVYVSPNKVSIDSHCWIDTNAPDAENRNQGLCIDQLDYKNEQGNIQASFDYNFNQFLIQLLPDYFYEGTQIPLNASIDLTYSPTNGVEGLIQSLVVDAKLVTQEQKIDVTAIVANFLIDNNKVTSSVFAGTRMTGAVGVLSELNLTPEGRRHSGLVSINNLILAPIQRFVPTIEKIDGVIQGRVEFDGPLEQPVFNGELSVSNAELAVASYPYPLKNFNQEILVVNNQVDIEGEFELGNGDAKYKANLKIGEGIEVEGEIIGDKLQLAVADQTIVASPTIAFKLNPNNLEISGAVSIPKADINIKSLPESAKAPSSDVIILGGIQEPPVLPIGLNVDIQIVIDSAKQGRVEISALDLDATLQGDLRVIVKQEKNIKENTYSPMQTLVYGSINTLSGSYEAYGQNLQIQKGTIFFNGVPSLPQFDITAIRNPLNTADNVIAGIRVSGNPIIPKVELFSEPTMIQARQLSYLLQGTDLGGGEGTSNDVMLVNALVSFGIGNSENGINKLGQSLGLDSLNLQTAGQGTNTQVQLSGRISDNIQITYGVGLFDQASELILKYQLMPQLYIEAKSGATSAVDLFYEITRGG